MIKLTIRTKNGTTVSLDIPEIDEISLENRLHEALQAPTIAEPIETRVEEPFARQDDDLQPSDKGFKSVEDMIAAQSVDEILARDIGEKDEEGEVGGEGGGCKGEEGEVEGEEKEKPESLYDLNHTIDTALDLFQFPCQSGIYTPPMQLTRDFVLAFGEEHVTKEFLKARSWLIANQNNRKTQRGMGRFLNAWLCREAGMKRVAVKAVTKPTGSLLDHGTQDSQGW